MTDDKPVLFTFHDPKNRPKSSLTIGKLATALAKAQGDIQNAEKDAKGTYGKYATLASTWDAIRPSLSKNEIAIYQRPLEIDGKLKMCTMLMHSSGEFFDDSELEMIFDRSGGRLTPMQAMGSAVTYARRYTLQSAVGVAPTDDVPQGDDDGVAAGKNDAPVKAPDKKPVTPPVPQKKKVNYAPASADLFDKLVHLAFERGVGDFESSQLLLAYGVDNYEHIPTWIAEEIANFLSNPETNAGTVMAEAARVKIRREAALKAKGIVGP